MRDAQVEQFTVDGLSVAIYYDDNCMSPRDQDNLGVIHGNHRHYTIGDGPPSDQEERALERGGLRLLERYLRLCEGAIAFEKVGMIDHSGIAFYLGGGAHFGDPGGWDSGTVGYTYVTRARCEELGAPIERVEEFMRDELEEYSKWASGQCYGFVITDPEGEVVESCWGFIGLEYITEEARITAKYEAVDHIYVDAAPVEEALGVIS
jgi:hypothetical protein